VFGFRMLLGYSVLNDSSFLFIDDIRRYTEDVPFSTIIVISVKKTITFLISLRLSVIKFSVIFVIFLYNHGHYLLLFDSLNYCLQCFDAVGWAS